MTLNEAHKEINDRFIALWSNPSVPYTFTDEDDFSDRIDTSWVRLSLVPTISGQHSLGKKPTRVYERRGLIAAQVFSPSNTGSKTAEDLANDIQTIYEGETFSGVHCFDSNIIFNGNSCGWFQINVDISFLFHEIK